MSESAAGPRTYNQTHIPRKYAQGKRRFSIYWTWSYPWEANRDVTEMDNRFSTITEVRRVAWPNYETPEFSAKMFLQGIAGTLELFHLSTLKFQRLVGEATEQPVAIYQRIDQAGQRLPIDERILEDTDTLMIFGLDHMVTEQEASPDEIDAVRRFLTREGTCLILGPHHDVGVSSDLKERAMEYAHHGDPLGAAATALRSVYAFDDEGLRRACSESVWSAPGNRQRHESDCSIDCLSRSRLPRMAIRSYDFQLSSSSSSLCLDHGRHEVHSCFVEAIY